MEFHVSKSLQMVEKYLKNLKFNFNPQQIDTKKYFFSFYSSTFILVHLKSCKVNLLGVIKLMKNYLAEAAAI